MVHNNDSNMDQKFTVMIMVKEFKSQRHCVQCNQHEDIASSACPKAKSASKNDTTKQHQSQVKKIQWAPPNHSFR